MSGKILRASLGSKKRQAVRGGMDCKQAIKLASALGCRVRPIAGEVVISHPKLPKVVRLNARKKDAPRSLIVALRKLQG